MNMQQVTMRWTIPSGTGAATVLNYDTTISPSAIAAAFTNFGLAIRSVLVPSVRISLDPEIRIIDEVTGQLQTVGSLTPPPYVDGSNATSDPVADASQGLIRLHTPGVVNGRRVLGHTYIPGIANVYVQGGNVHPDVVAALAAAGNALRSGGALLVWHRPVDGAGGSKFAVTSATGWSEWAVQRRRRTR